MDAAVLNSAISATAVPAQLPVVAIVGRPNVGKSTLFNRLVRRQRALVDSQPGVTRDRNIAVAQWNGRSFLLVDTGGFEDADRSPLAASVRAQSALAAEEAHAVIAVFDGRAGLSPADRDFVAALRRLRKPVWYAVNKLDTAAHDDEVADFFALGLDEVFPLSTAHGRGVAELLDHVVEPFALTEAGAARTDAVRLAIIGRPNVGKSSLLNRLVGAERAIVDATPGTTRDAVDTPVRYRERQYVVVDTAGIRRRPHVHEHLERASVVRALRAIERAELAVLVLDATEGVTDQDARIAGYAWDRGRALLFVANKWDALARRDRNAAAFAQRLRDKYATLADVPVICLSARTGAHVDELFPAVEKIIAAHHQQCRTAHLNEVLNAATRAQAPASVKGKRPRFYYATQTATAPATITIFSSHPELVQTSYLRYLTNEFRSAFDFQGTPVRLRFVARPRRA
jgi:GTPase